MDNSRSALSAALAAGFGRDIPPRMGSAPGFELSCTPGGTIFSTTPGGTRIMYDRSAMLNIRNSPMSRTPPVNMLQIPGVTTQASPHGEHAEEQHEEANVSQPELFAMDD